MSRTKRQSIPMLYSWGLCPQTPEVFRWQIREWHLPALLQNEKERRGNVTPLIAPHYALGRSSPLPIPSCGRFMVAKFRRRCQDFRWP